VGKFAIASPLGKMNWNSSRWRLMAWLGALFLAIFGAKLWLIQIYASGLPYWDQWDEARRLIQPWLDGKLTWTALFEPHNEHRIFFTRILDLAELWLNGQWDPLLQMVVNAALHASYACGLAYALWIFLGRKNAPLICLLLAPFFAFPFAAENTLHGFQSQMYFLDAFALVSIVGLSFAVPGSRRWIVGLIAAIFSLFAMGSGMLAALAVIGLLILRMLKHRKLARSEIVTLVCCLIIFGVGLLLNVTAEQDKPFRAHSIADFVTALAGNLAWPFQEYPAMLVLVCLPLLLTLIKYFRDDFQDPRAAEFILTFAFWGLLQSAGLAYARTHLGGSSRYGDTLSVVLLASIASLFILPEKMDFRRLSQPLLKCFIIGWVAILMGGLWQISWGTIGVKTDENYLQANRMWSLLEEENVRAFLATDDAAHLLGKAALAVPYWNPGWLIEILRQPKLQSAMPPDARAPIKLENARADAAFIPAGFALEKPLPEFTQTWGSFATNGAAATGEFSSQNIAPTFPKIMLPVLFSTESPDIKIQLVTASGHTTAVRPAQFGCWQTVVIDAPTESFRIEVSDHSQTAWVAVGEIKELGRQGAWARSLINHGVAFLIIGLGLFVGLTLSAWFWRKYLPAADQVFLLLAVIVSLSAFVVVWSARNLSAAEVTSALQQNWAKNYAKNGDAAGVARHLQLALCLQPNNPAALIGLANCVLQDSSLEKNLAHVQAVAYLEAALRLQPQAESIRKQLAELSGASLPAPEK
jgi:hypothetical protein